MIPEQIGLDLLRLYVAVCRQGSLSRAAAQANRTQSAVSMQMRRLEDLLGRRLFQRTGRGVVPTAEGGLDLLIAPTSVVAGDALVTWNVGLHWVAAADAVIDPDRPLDIVAFAMPCLWRRRMVEALTDAGRDHRIVMTSHSITALQAGIENGLGIGLLPPEAVRPGTMRVLSAGLPGPLTVQYGLYAPDRRGRVTEAAIAVLIRDMPRGG